MKVETRLRINLAVTLLACVGLLIFMAVVALGHIKFRGRIGPGYYPSVMERVVVVAIAGFMFKSFAAHAFRTFGALKRRRVK